MKKYLLISLTLAFTFHGMSQVVFFSDAEAVSELNSPSSENYIFLDFDKSEIYFTKEHDAENRHGAKDAGDIWFSTLGDSTWSEPANLKVNDKAFAAPAGMTADGFFIYHRVEFSKGRNQGAVMAINVRGKASEVTIPYFQNKSPLQTGTLSHDGRYLLLSLENNLGYGVDDLFVCELKQDGTWSAPKNLGNAVNTSLQELTPFLAADNKTLYFASNGRGGAGSFDIFQSRRLDDTWQNWSKPTTLGTDVNTSGAETSFIFAPDSEYAYFISTQNSDGYGDIKRIKIKTDITPSTENEIVQLRVAQARVKDSIAFTLVDKKTQAKLVGSAVITNNGKTRSLASGENGKIFLKEDELGNDVEFKVQGYLSVLLQPEEMAGKESVDVMMDPLSTGNVITLNHVLFYRGTANLVEGSEDELDLVVEMMEENEDIKIFLKGHTDNVGNSVLNIQLSRERVLAVEAYLLDNGIIKERIKGEGFGGEQPVASNETEETRKLNRRVEFEVIRD